MSQAQADRRGAALRLLASHRAGAIDLSIMVATFETGVEDPPPARQACLIVVSSGRTGAVFLSEPHPVAEPGGDAAALRERSACLLAAEGHLRETRPGAVSLLQALPNEGEEWFASALRGAGYVYVGTLSYLRRARGSARTLPGAPAWPEGVRLRTLADLGGLERGRAMLVDLLDRTYEGTLDCPALCGLRRTEDILDSHAAVGEFDTGSWLILERDGRPIGCALVSWCPDQRVSELVYLGLVPRERGRGLGRGLLGAAVRTAMARREAEAVVCAVDASNTPAVSAYRGAGFRAFSGRTAWVKPLG